jgi:signal transduction histidine kinase
MALLVLAVAVPAVCVLWFMNEATANVRDAARQRLTEAYRGRLENAQAALDAWWSAKVAALQGNSRPTDGTTTSSAAGPAPDGPAQSFARIVSSGAWDTTVVWTRGKSYPEIKRPEFDAILGMGGSEASAPMPEETDGTESGREWEWSWNDAANLERGTGHPGAAARAYADLAAAAKDAPGAARALQAQARCLIRDGRTSEALLVLSRLSKETDFRNAVDGDGRFIAPNAQLTLLELEGKGGAETVNQEVENLAARLRDYTPPAIPSAQRRFLMRQVQSLAPGTLFPTQEAEDLAAQWLDAPELNLPAVSFNAQFARVGFFWGVGVREERDGRSARLGLLRVERFRSEMESLLNAEARRDGVLLALLSPDGKTAAGAKSQGEPFLTAPASPNLPGWTLALIFQGPDPFAAVTARQTAIYLWTGILVIAGFGGMALLLGRFFLREMRLTRLKNDLIATVSHELKTPLASMRVLVDTLLEGRCGGEQQRTEYLQMMAQENARLTRLIDNFLTFSRMERNKRAFVFRDVSPSEIVREASEAVRERFENAGCAFEIQEKAELPALVADKDAMVTVLLNLLDNAFKYTGDNKRIVLRVRQESGEICFEVEDNGIGLPRRAIKRIFDRFYQVDQSLSRKGAGCGLGLSIVKFIVEAHGGRIGVESKPGQGSRFTVRLPLASAADGKT